MSDKDSTKYFEKVVQKLMREGKSCLDCNNLGFRKALLFPTQEEVFVYWCEDVQHEGIMDELDIPCFNWEAAPQKGDP